MIVEMENYKFEVKRVTHLTAIDTITPCYFVVLYLCWNRVTSLVWCQFWLQILTKKSILAFELLKSLIKQENWYLSNKVNFLSILLLLLKKFFVVRFVSYNYQFFWKIWNLLKKFEVIAYISNWAFLDVHNPGCVFWTCP